MAHGSHLSLKQTAASLAVIAAMTAVDAAPALAQLYIEEITVTTRKRSENLQDVPLVIKAFTAETLERKGINSIDDIARLTPGLQFDQGTFPQAINIVIRGLSPTLGRPNVGLLLDGVDVSSESVTSGGGSLLINPRLFDMERVEVVKGPQSALFGRSAFGGAINYVTKKPTNEWEGKVSLQGGQRNDFEGNVGIYGPVVEDKFLIGVNASVWNFDGYYDNSVTGADLGDNDGYGLATSMIFNFNEDISFTARVEYTNDHLGQAPIAFIGQNTVLPIPAAAIGTVISPQVPTVGAWVGRVPDAKGIIPAISEDPTTGEEYRGSDREIFRVAGTLDWDLGFGSFTSVTHLANANIQQAVENTRQGSLNLLNYGTTFNTDAETELFSQEFRLQSNDEDRLRWLVGGLYWEETVEQDTLSIACTNNQVFPFAPFIPCGPLLAANANAEPNYWLRDTEHWSAFAMLEYDITEQLTLHVEGRYTDEKLLVSGPTAARLIDALGINPPFIPVTMPPNSPNIEGTVNDSYFTPRFSVEYTPNDDMLFYASVAKGAKPSGVSTASAAASGFDPVTDAFDREEMWVYEVGSKTTWLDGRVVANGALYYQDFSGKQASSQVLQDNGLLGTRIVNASSAEVKGLELDAAWAPTDGLNLSLGYAYVDSQYQDFVTNTGGPAPIAAVGNCRPITIAGRTVCEVDRSGNELEDVSKHSLNLGVAYTQALTDDINWLIETDIQYQDDRFDTADNLIVMPGYWLVDLRVGLQSENWNVIAFADNLFNDDTVKTAFNAIDFSTIRFGFAPPFTFVLTSGLQANLPAKRQIGLRTTFNF